MNGRINRWIVVAAGVAGIMLLAYLALQYVNSIKAGRISFDRPEVVSSIEIVERTDTLRIVRVEGTWRYADGEELNQDAVDNILAALSRIRIQSVYLPEEIDMSASTRFTLFRNNKPLHVFRVLSSDNRVLMTGKSGEEIYSVELPGFDLATLAKVFSNEPDHYREHLLLSLLPGEIRDLTIRPFSSTSFRVVQDSTNEVQVYDPESGQVLTDSISIHEIRMLLSYFNTIRYERRINDAEIPEILDPNAPDAGFVVKQTDGRVHQFQIWKWIPEGAGEADLYRALVKVNGIPGFMLVNFKYLDLILRELQVYMP